LVTGARAPLIATPTVTRYDIRCQSAPWMSTTIHGSYSDAHKKASIISEECYDMG